MCPEAVPRHRRKLEDDGTLNLSPRQASKAGNARTLHEREVHTSSRTNDENRTGNCTDDHPFLDVLLARLSLEVAAGEALRHASIKPRPALSALANTIGKLDRTERREKVDLDPETASANPNSGHCRNGPATTGSSEALRSGRC
jgi:hypothetical protein